MLVFTRFEKAVVVSKDGIITEANPRFLEMFGLNADQVRGRSLMSWFPREPRAGSARAWQRADDNFYEFFVRRDDGFEFPWKGRGASLRGTDGVLLRVLRYASLTEAQNDGSSLRDSERRSVEAAKLKSVFMAT